MTPAEAQIEGERRWGKQHWGRAWHMFPNDPSREYFKLEWPDGVIKGQGKSFEEAFEQADKLSREAA